ncbi:MAG: hypothetical protein V1744_05865, partial [Candidatus Altiarchaeota archaeon]
MEKTVDNVKSSGGAESQVPIFNPMEYFQVTRGIIALNRPYVLEYRNWSEFNLDAMGKASVAFLIQAKAKKNKDGWAGDMEAIRSQAARYRDEEPNKLNAFINLKMSEEFKNMVGDKMKTADANEKPDLQQQLADGNEISNLAEAALKQNQKMPVYGVPTEFL